MQLPNCFCTLGGEPTDVPTSTTLAKKIVTAEKFMRLIDDPIMWYRAVLSFGSTVTRLEVAARRELALQIEVDVARYHMIALRINLMNISAVTIFLARVVLPLGDGTSGSTSVHLLPQLIILPQLTHFVFKLVDKNVPTLHFNLEAKLKIGSLVQVRKNYHFFIKTTSSANVMLLRKDLPSIWDLGHFLMFAPWYRRSRKASSVKTA